VSFVLENKSASDLIFSVSHDNFLLRDNLGNRSTSTGWGWACYQSTWQVIVKPGSRLRTVDCTPHGTVSKVYNDRLIWFPVDITNQSINEVTVTVRDLSRMKSASWRVPVPH
jgi:hypothetical protein